MKIILNADVYNLGEEGDICDVARGYARNYLLPKKLAVLYSSQNLAILESRKTVIENKKDEKRRAALSLKEKIDGTEIDIKMNVGQGGRLFGSVTNAMIADELQKQGIELEKKRIDITSHTIKMTGTYTIKVKLYENNEAELKLNVINQNETDRATAEAEKKVEEKESPAPEATSAEATAPEEAPSEEASPEESPAGETLTEEPVAENTGDLEAEAEAESVDEEAKRE